MKAASAILRSTRIVSPLRSLIPPTVLARRHFSMESSLQSPPFTQLVVKAMRTLYPEELADRAWDNAGLLQDNIKPPSGTVPPRVLLTNDLTPSVAEEAIQKNASVIVSYHPFIFRGLKSITLDDPQQRIVLRLAQHNIAVYSPHTASDAAPLGVNDWLVDQLRQYPLAKMEVIQPLANKPEHFSHAGYGRIVTLGDEVDLDAIVHAYGQATGMRHVLVVKPKGFHGRIRTVAVCAGSGYDVVKDVETDVVVTGEMSHHNALRLKMLGRCVICLCHSNSERGWLRDVLEAKLLDELRKEEPAAEVLVSEEDEDPFQFYEVPHPK
ncbi:hypothetical protein VTJ49DRAFT_2598 [Mycothermus thermophilus]|uniref:Uncharacterized protein n=1 Tax=Humicola insolens TaxID=85995 RepID=A0ABR3V9L6_HUMIN